MVIQDQTIVAQCTPNGPGALALIRISGAQALTIGDAISQISSSAISKVPSHTIHYGSIIDAQGALIDRVLFLVMHGPRTFTGEDTVEITCHNNPFIIESIIQESIRAGARLADNGEFTKRAVLNEKIDLVQAEAINELIHANTQQALKLSLAQANGSLSQWISLIEKILIKALAFSEASFEFIDEEDLAFGAQIAAMISDIQNSIKRIKITFNQQQQIRNGIRIALIGSVNAGKSSLFNTLLRDKRAIVTNIAGTTRDAIEAGLYKNGTYWTLIDTAGLRQTDDHIEQEGIQRSLAHAQTADIILLVIDGSRALTPQEQHAYEDLYGKFLHKCIIVRTKNDLIQLPINWLDNKNSLPCIHDDQQSISVIENNIQEKIESLLSHNQSPYLINKRQFNLLIALEQKLDILMGLLSTSEGEIPYELVSYHITQALADMAELTGKTMSEAGMDAVFREFCVGK